MLIAQVLTTPLTSTETTQARAEAHAAFDVLWRTGRMSRKRAHRWLRISMNVPEHEAHICRFDVAQCRQLLVLVERELGVVRS